MKKGLYIIYFESIFRAAVGFVVAYLVINYFSEQDYGIYKFLMSVAATFAIFFPFGLNATAVRYIPEKLVKNQYQEINYLIVVSLAIQLLLVGMSVAFLYYAYEFEFIAEELQKVEFFYFACYVALSFFGIYLGNSLLVAFSKRVLLTYIRLLLFVVQLILIALAIDNQVSLNEFIKYLVYLKAIESLFFIAAISVVYVRCIPDHRFRRFQMREVVGYSMNNYGFSWVNYLRDNAATIIVVGYLFSFTEVAYYSVALIIPNLVRAFTPSKVFGGFLMPEFVKGYTQDGDRDSVLHGASFLMKLNWIFLLSAIVYSVFLYEFVVGSFFGEQYAEKSYHIALFLFFNIIALAYLDLNIIAANTFKRSDLVFKLNILSISNIVFLFLFSEFGTYGIGLANLLSTLAVIISFHFVFKALYKKGVDLTFDELVKLALFGASLIIVSIGLVQLSVYVYMICYPVAVLLLLRVLGHSGYFSSDQVELILATFPKVDVLLRAK